MAIINGHFIHRLNCFRPNLAFYFSICSTSLFSVKQYLMFFSVVSCGILELFLDVPLALMSSVVPISP